MKDKALELVLSNEAYDACNADEFLYYGERQAYITGWASALKYIHAKLTEKL